MYSYQPSESAHGIWGNLPRTRDTWYSLMGVERSRVTWNLARSQILKGWMQGKAERAGWGGEQRQPIRGTRHGRMTGRALRYVNGGKCVNRTCAAGSCHHAPRARAKVDRQPEDHCPILFGLQGLPVTPSKYSFAIRMTVRRCCRPYRRSYRTAGIVDLKSSGLINPLLRIRTVPAVEHGCPLLLDARRRCGSRSCRWGGKGVQGTLFATAVSS